MKIQIENLMAQMRGVDLNIHQKADALIEFKKLLEYVEELEKLPKSIFQECINEQKEIVSSPIRFNGVHIEKIKQVFLKNGVQIDDPNF